MTRCARGECIPDRSGFCIYCRHELLTEVDDDGTPIECDCTEEAIVKGCPIHDKTGNT